MNPSKEHNNWITVGELIRLLRNPLASYVTKVIENWHVNLRRDCLQFGKCSSPEDCLRRKRAQDLCPQCFNWFQKLADNHQNSHKSQIKWRQNCDTSKWPDDAWEVAKFFMSPLGDNKNSVRNAESTDLSSLLNVLERLKDEVFDGNARISVTLLRKLRSEVRNAWAHAPKQETSEGQRDEAFKVADEFLMSLNRTFSHENVEAVLTDVRSLNANDLTNVVEAELESLIMWRKEMSGDVGRIKEEIKDLKENQSSDRAAILDSERKLKALEDYVEDYVERMIQFGKDFERWRENLDYLYKDLQRMETFRDETKKELSEMRESIKKLQACINEPFGDGRSKLKSCIPEKLSTFVGREKEVENVLYSLLEKETAIVSLVGGPGFGKSTAAVEVAHRLSDLHQIPVFFSSVRSASSISEVIIRVCHVMGVQLQEDATSSLVFWLKSVQGRAVLVIDNIEHLLEDKTQDKFIELLRLLRMHSGGRLQILLTSRRDFDVCGLKAESISIQELDGDSSIQLVRNCYPGKGLKVDYIGKLVSLCGHVPLAICIAASRPRDVDDPEQLLDWLKQKPMKLLQTPQEKVENSFEMSFGRLKEADKSSFTRLSVFDGNFDRRAAEKVTDQDDIEMQNILSRLVNRNLVEQRGKRYSLHPLIRSFLLVRVGFDQERIRAEEGMVEHFLKVSHALTLKY